MPRESPYVVYLTDMERRNLEAVARKYMSPYVDVIRASSSISSALSAWL